jgi:hypothetical protein
LTGLFSAFLGCVLGFVVGLVTGFVAGLQFGGLILPAPQGSCGPGSGLELGPGLQLGLVSPGLQGGGIGLQLGLVCSWE